MKKYFLAFDFYDRNINKFFFGIITVDLGEISLPEIAKDVIKEKFTDIDSESVTIKITSFNNID